MSENAMKTFRVAVFLIPIIFFAGTMYYVVKLVPPLQAKVNELSVEVAVAGSERDAFKQELTRIRRGVERIEGYMMRNLPPRAIRGGRRYSREGE